MTPVCLHFIKYLVLRVIPKIQCVLKSNSLNCNKIYLLPTYIYVKWGGIISVKKSDLERVKYLERAGKWFKIRAVMIVLVFAGTILAMVAMATLAPVALSLIHI